MTQPYHWRATGRDGAAIEVAGDGFPSQGEAESWLAENWQELSNAGAGAVTLLAEGAVVYGPMSLDPAD